VAENKLKYTNLTYDDIQRGINDSLVGTQFDNFRESAIGQTLIEIFSGTTDILNYYIERRAEECFFDTAQLKSSVISLSRMLGYVMNRSEPARASLRLRIMGDIDDNVLQIPYYSTFSYGGNNYLLLNTFTYNLSTEQYNEMKNKKSQYQLLLTSDSFGIPIDIVQGDIREKVISGLTNYQVNSPFQIYKIEDNTFSNLYGDKDYFYDKITKVYVGENKTADTQFTIDRRSLLNWENIATSDLTTVHKVCNIRTSPDGFVELLFGDNDPTNPNSGGFARKGALSRKDNIYVQYLSTNGASANISGVIGKKVSFSGKIYNSKNADITNKIQFELDSNIFGGANDESIDSIKYSAPKIYYSMDRLVSKADYIGFLKSLTTPIDIRNAVVWGEQEERDKAKKFALIRMFNSILFSVCGSLYNLQGNIYTAKSGKEYSDVVLDLEYSPYAWQTQGYMNIFVLQKMVAQLVQYKTKTSFYEITGGNLGELASNQVVINPTDSSQVGVGKTVDQIAENIKANITTYFPTGTSDISFFYKSDIYENVAYIEAKGKVTITGLTDPLFVSYTGNTYLTELAKKINDSLLAFIDARGNTTENQNYGQPAFYGRFPNNALFIWDSTQTDLYLFRTRFNETLLVNPNISPCHIVSFNADTLLNIIGMANAQNYLVTETVYNKEVNGKITSVVDELAKRSQVNVKNIYVSPIIHRFNLVGTVYVKDLYDKMEVKRLVTNAIYKWLDANADFTVPLYLSNIIEIIESELGVIHANVKLMPEDITLGWNNKNNFYYDPNYLTNLTYQKFATQYAYKYTEADIIKIASIVNSSLWTYLDAYLNPNTVVNETSVYYDLIRKFYTSVQNTDGTYNSEPNTLESTAYRLDNIISERSFYDMVGDLYATLKDLYPEFVNLPEDTGDDVVHDIVIDSYFAVVMSQVYKDLSYIIMENMLDSNSNIDVEYDKKNNRSRGGYSLGSEIVQVILEGKDSNNMSLLNFVYR